MAKMLMLMLIRWPRSIYIELEVECEKPNILMHFEKTLLKCTFGKYTFKYRELELICKKLVNGENAGNGRFLYSDAVWKNAVC